MCTHNCEYEIKLQPFLTFFLRSVSLSWYGYSMRVTQFLNGLWHIVVVLQALLKAEADVDSLDRWQKTPLDEAIRSNHPQVIEVLKAQRGRQKGRQPQITNSVEIKFLCVP